MDGVLSFTDGKPNANEWIAEMQHIRQHLLQCTHAATMFDEMIMRKVLEFLPKNSRLITTILETKL